MKAEAKNQTDWDLLIGYSVPEAEEILQEEGIPYQLQFTAPPGKKTIREDSRVIAVQEREKIVLICASADWTVS